MKTLPVVLLASILGLSTRSAAVAQLPTTAPLVTEAVARELYRSPVPALFATVPTAFDSAYTTRYGGGTKERIAFVSQVVAGDELVIEGYQTSRPTAALRLTRGATTPVDGLDTVAVYDGLLDAATTYVRQWRAGELMNVLTEAYGRQRIEYYTYTPGGLRTRRDGGDDFLRELYTYDDAGRFDTWSRAVGPDDEPALTRAYRYEVRPGADTLSLTAVDIYDGADVVVGARYTADDSTLTYVDRAIEGTTELLYRSDDGQDSTRLSFIGRYEGEGTASFVETVYRLSSGFASTTGVRAPRTPVQFGGGNPLRPGASVTVTTALNPGAVTYRLVSADGRALSLSPRGGRITLPGRLPAGAYVLTASAPGFAPYAKPIVIR